MMSNDNDDGGVSMSPHNDAKDNFVLFVGKVVDDTGDDERKDDTSVTHPMLESDLLISVAVVVYLGMSSSVVVSLTLDDDLVTGVELLT